MPRATTFTTYLNVAEDKANAAVWARYERQALSSYATISRAADQASSAVAGLIGGRGAAGLGGQFNQTLKSRTAELGRVAAAQDRATTSADRTTGATKRQGDAAEVAAKKNSAFASSLRTTAQTLQIVQGPLGPLAGRVSAVANALEELTGFRLGIAGVGASLFALANSASKYTEIESRLRPLFDTQTQVNRAMSEVSGIALRARTSLEPVADLYAKLTLAGREYGFSQERIAKLTELASKAATLSGGGTQTRNAGLGQFAQALGSGNLGGDELRSIKENTLVLAQQIALGFKNADGSIGTTIGKLKELGSEGKLTSVEIAEALERSAARIETAYSRLPQTLSTSAAAFGNAVLLDVGKLDQSIGLTRTLASTLQLVTDNLRIIVSLGAGVATTFAAFKAASFVKDIAAQASAWIATQREIRATAVAEQQESATASAAAIKRLRELEAERLAIGRVILELQAKQSAEATQVVRAQNLASTGTAAQGRLYGQEAAKANEQLRYTTQQLTQAQERNRAVVQQLGPAMVDARGKTEALEVATKNVTARVGMFRAAGSSLLGLLGGPWGIVFAAAATALYAFATASTAAERGAKILTSAQIELGEAAGRAAAKLDQSTAAARRASLETIRSGALDLQTAYTGSRNAFGSRLLDARKSVFGTARTELENLVARVGRGEDIEKVYVDYAKLRDRTPALQGESVANRVGRAFGLNSRTPIEDAYFDVRKAATNFRSGRDNYNSARREADQLGSPKPGSAGGTTTATSVQQLGAQAIAAAVDKGSDTIRAAGARRRDAIASLDSKYSVKGGKLGDASQADAYRAERVEIEKRYNGEVEAIKSASAARTSARAQDRKDAAEAKREAAAAERERKQTLRENAGSKLESGMAALEDQRPGLSTQQYLDARLRLLETYDREANAIDETAKKSTKAADQKTQDARRAGAAIQASRRDYEQQYQVQQLLLQGRDEEARALERTLQLVNDIGDAGRGEYSRLLGEERQQLRINDALASRQRIVSSIQGLVGDAREELTSLLSGEQSTGDFVKNLWGRIRRVSAQQLTEQLFAGADEKVRALISGTGGVETQTAFLVGRMGEAGTAAGSLASATEKAATAIEGAAERLERVADAPVSSGGGGASELTVAQAGIARLTAAYIAANPTGPEGSGDEIVVTGRQSRASVLDTMLARTGVDDSGLLSLKLPDEPIKVTYPQSVYGVLGSVLGDAIGGKTGAAVGKVFSSALQGAGLGQTIGGIIGGQSGARAGSAVGGTLGAISGLLDGTSGLGGKIGKFAGKAGGVVQLLASAFELGSIIGEALFGKSNIARAQITSVSQENRARGNDVNNINAVQGTVTGVQQTLQKIIDALGGTEGSFAVSIGKWNDYYRVSASASNRVTDKRYPDTAGADLLYDGQDAEQAIRAAVLNALQDGAVQGIREGSKRLLAAGRDIETAVTKALKFENVFLRLKAATDPVGAAVDALNKEFRSLQTIFKEAGASAEEYAQLEQLYGIERTNAISQATEAAAGAIDQFLKDMVGSSSSPLNRLDTYANAKKDLEAFRTDISAGKIVDQNDLLAAARNYQDASRALNGSGQAFFDDFNALRDLLARARDNAGIGNVTTLPASPFADSTAVTDAISSLNGTTADQTASLGARLDNIYAALVNLGAEGGGGGSSIDRLPGFSRPF